MTLRVDVLTLFPNMFESPFAESIVARARAAGQIELAVHDIRQWATDRHHVVDDAPYGGGAGMVLKPEPLTRAIRATKGERGHVVLMSAQGALFDQLYGPGDVDRGRVHATIVLPLAATGKCR